jgi:simple sugar transport system ATP-binding protein
MNAQAGVGTPSREQAAAVEARNIWKRFGSTQALKGVSLTLPQGRCLGLVGRNGAGKSTLVSILSGIYGPDSGTVRLGGGPVPSLADRSAWRARIATVYQHSMVVPGLTVAENVFLNAHPGTGGLVDWREMRARTGQIMAEWGFDVKADQPCGSITVEQRQIVEIARALAAGTRCLLLDEPTAALERGAVKRLFERVRQLTDSGVAVLYISHHLEEVFELCEDVVVMRDGEVVLTSPTAQLSHEQLVASMVGVAPGAANGAATGPGTRVSAQAPMGVQRTGERPPATVTAQAAPGAGGRGGPPRLVVQDLHARSPRGSLEGVSFVLQPGERVGVTGLLGSGVATLARVLAGAVPIDSGTVLLDGQPLPDNVHRAVRAGVGFVPEDRRAEGFVGRLGVAENVTMTLVDRIAGPLGFLRHRRMAEAARPVVTPLSLVSSGMNQPVGELSGGNQQKVTVARALARRPKLVVAITPTRGVDVASKALLLDQLAQTAQKTGAALLLATDELDDLVICERILIIVRGKVVREMSEPFDREEVIAASEGFSSETPAR